jgi:hypothetical protein
MINFIKIYIKQWAVGKFMTVKECISLNDCCIESMIKADGMAIEQEGLRDLYKIINESSHPMSEPHLHDIALGFYVR